MGSGRSTTSSSSSASSSSASSTNSPSSASFRSKSHADLTSTSFTPLTPSASSNGGITRRNRSDSLFNDPTTPDDVWRQLTLTISVAVQRLVSIGTVKANVAHLLLEVPLWARSSAELRKTLSSEVVKRDWEVVESCGMKEKAEVGVASTGDDELDEDGEDRGPLSVCHPAYRALVNGTMSRGPYVEHCVAFIKVSSLVAFSFSLRLETRSSLSSSFLLCEQVVYESHLLSVLMGQGGMSRGNAEMTLTALVRRSSTSLSLVRRVVRFDSSSYLTFSSLCSLLSSPSSPRRERKDVSMDFSWILESSLFVESSLQYIRRFLVSRPVLSLFVPLPPLDSHPFCFPQFNLPPP